MMDLTGYSDPFVHYERWFFCDLGSSPDDSLQIFMNNGTTIERIDVQVRDTNTHGSWIIKDIRIQDYISLSSTMQFIVRTSDFAPDINVTEAAIDDFFIVESEFVSLPENESKAWRLYPNPSTGMINVANLNTSANYEVRTLSGKHMQSGVLKAGQSIDGSAWDSGIYFVKINDEVQKIVIAR
jgi:hypothetical protein